MTNPAEKAKEIDGNFGAIIIGGMCLLFLLLWVRTISQLYCQEKRTRSRKSPNVSRSSVRKKVGAWDPDTPNSLHEPLIDQATRLVD